MGGCLSVLPWGQAVTQACNSLFGDGNYIHMMKANLEALEASMQTLRDRRDDLYEYGKKVSKKLEEVTDLLRRGNFEEVAIKGPLPKVDKKDIKKTVGLDSMVGKAWDIIMKPERRTLGIYGMGGVGKTTLLTHINNKLEKEVNGFDVVIWVVVSKDLQYKGIQDQILRRLCADKDWEKETEKEKKKLIGNNLGRKKFVLLLDDLWSEVDLNKIGVPRPTQENGSKIVFTTRSEKVCSDMEADDELKMDCLPATEAWELFQNAVGEVRLKGHPDIPSLAEKICEKCYGLPLALNVIGKAMKSMMRYLAALSAPTFRLYFSRVTIWRLTSLQYLNLSYTGMKGLRKLISLDLERTFVSSIDGIGTSLPNLQVLKLYYSSVYIDARSIEELQLLEHLKILTVNVKDALILESIQRVERLASCVQCLSISGVSAEVLTLNTAALGGLRKLFIGMSKISEIKIDWKNKEKEDLLCNSSPYFRHLSSFFIYDLEGPKELTWLLFAPNLKHLEVIRSPSLEEIINKEKGMSISNVHPPDMMVPFQKLQLLSLERLPELKRICSSPPPALPSLGKFVVDDCPKLPEAAIREFQRHEQE
ncbi:BnaAnng30420D [Brassica napus]|uniref:BnaAnng30420D protein n=1 Tax=Brassica napus TaxID=3708 RepID=A0A078JV02_BRANA|nr:BnaAnng30420D [Brassica napus]